MNYYKRHIGDYAAKAGHLSPLEHGVYTLLLDAYYNREEGPTRAEAIRWARARSVDEVSAVDSVLTEFFTEVDGRFIQARVEDELSSFRVTAETNRRIAVNREAAKRARDEHEACSKREPSHKPLAINHKEDQEQGASAPTSRKPRGVTLTEWIDGLAGAEAIPADDPVFDWAAKVGLPREWVGLAWWSFEGRYTLGTPQQQAKRYTDWRATFRDHVTRDFLGLWKLNRDGEYFLTTAGQQAMRESRA